MADEDEDFEFQLRQQQLHAETAGQQPEGEQSGSNYTDPNDGTVYEWDAEKRAWFPKAREVGMHFCIQLVSMFYIPLNMRSYRCA